MFEKITTLVTTIKKTKPLVLNITNDVTMDFVANGVLSVGASPVMSKAKQEMEDLIKLAGAVVINLGTLDEQFIQLCEEVCAIANRLKKPIVLDPVGAGASAYRTHACMNLINQYAISIIRGNASEVIALSGMSFATKGVDSTVNSEAAVESAQAISKKYHSAVVISGKTDVIVDDDQLAAYQCGSALMPMVTGTGCLLTAVVGAFHAVEQDRFHAAAAATLFYGVCGEVAAENAAGPGSFKTRFLDALHSTPNQGWYK